MEGPAPAHPLFDIANCDVTSQSIVKTCNAITRINIGTTTIAVTLKNVVAQISPTIVSTIDAADEAKTVTDIDCVELK